MRVVISINKFSNGYGFIDSQIGGSGGCYVLYDTFSFKLTLPPTSNKLEFCVCFRADGKEVWDSNNVSFHYTESSTLWNWITFTIPKCEQGTNYVILKRSSKYGNQTSSFLIKTEMINASQTNVSSPIGIPNKYSDLTQAKMNSWSEFASWTHLENTSPYWWFRISYLPKKK